ncbi:short-chain dehydrogenase [Diplodia corticola]|uniref:Short-chain dehydrogenase n=1 Tax=Diplodia corticola TaxID=236234 RepID=A0A1J9RTW8_9PEZI|nr:short-chain dehydrogenase [Diplodia corticola]OJD36011.1 short-chain dehydrogenase [Diplodia corticola]
MSGRITPYAPLHATPNGPGDQRPTALQIVQDEHLVDKWADKAIFITGANQGLGLETARALHATGATLYLGVRTLAKGETARSSILATSPSQTLIHLVQLSLDSLDSVRAAAAAFLSQSPTLNILINNAGIMACPQHSLTADGHESQFGTNHLGHFLLTSLLMPALIAGSSPGFASRVVNLSSAGHKAHGGASASASPLDLSDLSFSRRAYHPWRAYGAAKTANVLHANRVDALYGTANVAAGSHGKPVHAFSVNPGGIFTALFKYVSDEEKKRYQAYRQIFKSPEQGAATTVWCATAAVLEGKGGFYCENCGEAEPGEVDGATGGWKRLDITYAPWVRGDVEAEERLWKVSEELVGLVRE